MNELPRKKVSRHERLLSEHAFDKLRMIDCGFAKFAESLEGAEVIEEGELQHAVLKELILLVEWVAPAPRRGVRRR